MSCPSCTEEVTSDSDFCPHCGILLAEAGDVSCDRHAARKAVAVCIICHATLCGSCSHRKLGRHFCTDHRRVEVVQDWVRVYQSDEVSEADLVRAVLEEAGLKVQVQNFGSMGYVWEGGGDSVLSRSAVGKPGKVFVPIPDYERALEVIAEWNEGGLPEGSGDNNGS
jgi:hypothetical protein